MTRDRLWIVALNDSRVRILRGLPRESGAGASELVLRSEHLRLRSLIDRAVGPAGVEPLRQDERDFLLRVIDLLETHRRASDFDALALFAAPSALEHFRTVAPAPLTRRIVAELAVCLLHLAPQEIATAASRHLALR